MLATLDRAVNDPDRGNGLLEVKTTGLFAADRWLEGVPDYHEIQVQHYLAVTGYHFADVAVLIGGQEYRDYTILPDLELHDALIEVERRFWEMIQAGVMPDLEGHPGDGAALLRMYPRATEDVLDLSGTDAERHCADYLEAASAIKAAKARQDEAKSNLKVLLGSAAKGVAGDDNVAWARFAKKSLDMKGLTAAHPALVAEWTSEKPSERFTVTRKGT